MIPHVTRSVPAGIVIALISVPAYAVTPVPLENAYWRMEEGRAGEPVPASTPVEAGAVLDVTGNGNHMRRYNLENAPLYTTEVPLDHVPATGAPNLHALRFSGTYQDIYTDNANGDYPKDINHPIVEAFTLEASFKTDVVGGTTDQTIVSKESTTDDTSSDYPPLALKIQAGTAKLRLELRDKGNNLLTLESLQPVQADRWYHAAVIATGSEVKLYLSENDEGGYVFQDATAVVGPGPFWMGEDQSGAYSTVWNIGKGMWARQLAHWFDGVIDEVRLSNTALDPCYLLFRPQPRIEQILLEGMTSLQLTHVHPSASEVRVYADGVLIGTNSSPGGSPTVTVDLSGHPLQNGKLIVATQMIDGCEGSIPTFGPVVGSCEQIPPVAVAGLTDGGRSVVRVMSVDPEATAVKVYAYDPVSTQTSLIGTNNNPGGAATVTVTVTPLVEGNLIGATQTVQSLEGCIPSTDGRRVTAAGVVEDFEGPVEIRDHPAPGVSGSWYDIAYNSYTAVLGPPNARASMPNGSRCINITDHGWTNGAYVRYDNIIPAGGTYHLVVDMLIDEAGDLDPDFYKQYQVGVIVNGAHRDPNSGIIPAVSGVIGEYPCLTPLRDGIGATEAVPVYVATFTADAGDSLLVVFSTHVDTGQHTANKTATPEGYVGMKVDNIRLVEGPKPPRCEDVDPVDVVPTSSYPLEEGTSHVHCANLDPNADLVKVWADTTEIGSVNPAGASELDIEVNPPLVAETAITATQRVSVAGVPTWSCQCPGAEAEVVGKGANSAIKLCLGVRETGCTTGCTIGGNGGITGTIEWVQATGKGANGEPLGTLLEMGPDWQEVTFAWPPIGSDAVTGFTGDNVVTGNWGTLESLNFAIDDVTNTGRYVVLIDNIKNGTTTIADFETDAPGIRNVFRNPTNSGSTNTNLMIYPDIAEVREETGKGAGGSDRFYGVEFQFLDGNPKRWLRLTTVDDDSSPDMPIQNPLIDLSQPVTVSLKLYGAPAYQPDRDGDGDVDMADFAALQRCLTLRGGPLLPECGVFDSPFDGVIDANDLSSFQDCAAGSGVPPACSGN